MPEKPAQEERFNYDAIVKDLFVTDRPSLLGWLAGKDAGPPGRVMQSLNVELPAVLTKVADLLLLMEDDSLFHLEFQSWNDRDMPFRMGVSGLLAAWKYRKKRIRQVTLYLGQPRMRMDTELDLGGIKVSYQLVDIRDLDAEVLLASSNPADHVMALLARGGEHRLREIVAWASSLDEPARRRYLTQLAVLSGLRGLSERLKIEVSRMELSLTVEENVFLREILERGRSEGRLEGTEAAMDVLADLLSQKFGALPEWAHSRIRAAELAQLRQWTKHVLAARTIDDVFGAAQ